MPTSRTCNRTNGRVTRQLDHHRDMVMMRWREGMSVIALHVYVKRHLEIPCAKDTLRLWLQRQPEYSAVITEKRQATNDAKKRNWVDTGAPNTLDSPLDPRWPVRRLAEMSLEERLAIERRLLARLDPLAIQKRRAEYAKGSISSEVEP